MTFEPPGCSMTFLMCLLVAGVCFPAVFLTFVVYIQPASLWKRHFIIIFGDFTEILLYKTVSKMYLINIELWACCKKENRNDRSTCEGLLPLPRSAVCPHRYTRLLTRTCLYECLKCFLVICGKPACFSWKLQFSFFRNAIILILYAVSLFLLIYRSRPCHVSALRFLF